MRRVEVTKSELRIPKLRNATKEIVQNAADESVCTKSTKTNQPGKGDFESGDGGNLREDLFHRGFVAGGD